jgi:hypothetical protein
VGAYNAAFSVGSAAGILSGIFFQGAAEWRIFFIISGILSLVMATLFGLIVSSGTAETGEKSKEKHEKSRYYEGLTPILSLSAAISSIAEALIGQEFVYYSVAYLHLGVVLAGITVASFMGLGFAGGLAWSYFFTSKGLRFRLYTLTIFIESIMFFVIPFARTLISIFVLISVVGILTSAGLSMLYSVVIFSSNEHNINVNLSFNNFTQKLISFASPTLFIVFGTVFNFSISWDIFGVSGLLLVLMLFARVKTAGQTYLSEMKI